MHSGTSSEEPIPDGEETGAVQLSSARTRVRVLSEDESNPELASSVQGRPAEWHYPGHELPSIAWVRLRDSLRLAGECLWTCLAARKRDDELVVDNNLILARQALGRVAVTSEELSGLAMCASALYYALGLRRGSPLSLSQLQLLVTVVDKMATSPFMRPEVAGELLARVSMAGLSTVPAELGQLWDE